ncbi:MAG: GAF domain-containing sensor histidine kinase [Tepidiformaceae bacterium]
MANSPPASSNRGDALRAREELLAFLAHAGEALASSLDYGSTLRSVTRLALPFLGDYCVVDLLRENGELERIAWSHRDPLLEREMDLAVPDGRNFGPAHPITRVLETGTPVVLHGDSVAHSIAVDDSHLGILERLNPHTYIVVPLTAAGETIGTIGFASEAALGPGDCAARLEAAHELARRAALAISNARNYRRAEERADELQRANESLRQANEMKDEFLGLVSHELRTPITIINGGARVLQTRQQTLDLEARQGLVDDIVNESGRLARMLDDLLALSRLGLDEELALEPVSLARFLERMLRERGSTRPRALRAQPGLAPVAAEPGYLEHVVANLLSNAEKYSPHGSAIEVELVATPAGAEVHFRDEGVGIAPEEAEAIFERFYRSKRTSGLARGAGIGLAVCRRLIEAMGGAIRAEPREGGGLDVSFLLPWYE